MAAYRFVGLLGVGSVLFWSSVAEAQCTKDTDCKGNRICEAGVCTDAAGGAPAPEPAPPAPAPVGAPAPVAAPPPASAPVTAPAPQAPPPTPAKGERHSTGMMVGGIVLVSLAPIALITSLTANIQKSNCELGEAYLDGFGNCDQYDATIYGGLIAAGAFTAIGIPLIIIGARREPAQTATVTPWATPHGGGLGLRVDL
jgi:hypothetical protein